MTSLTVSHSRHYSSQLSQGQTLAAFNSQTQALKYCTIATSVGIFVGLFTRLSICLFLLRIFRSVREWRLSLYAIMAFTVATTIAPVVSFIAQCQPIQKQWDPFLPGNCWSPLVVVRINYFGGGEYLCNFLLRQSHSLILCQRYQRSATGYSQLSQSSSCGICR